MPEAIALLGHPRVGAGILFAAAMMVASCGAGSPGSTASGAAQLPLANGLTTMLLVNVDGTPADTSISVLGGSSGPTVRLERAPAMLMITDTGSHPQSVRTAMPMADVQVDDTATGRLGALEATAPTISVTVNPGAEVDVDFTPTSNGSYPLSVDGQQVGTIVIGG